MTEAAAARRPAGEPAKGAAKPERVVYAAGGGRKTFFSFLFLILLPFFVSLPAMFAMRVVHGLWFDAIGLVVMAAAFAILMFLVVVELVSSLRTRIELGEDKVKMTLPSGRGPTPMLLFRTHEIPYGQVDTVETRREIYGGSLVPVLLTGARIITKDGKTIPLGYVSDANVDPTFPFPEIARQIAERARLPLIDRGNVVRSFRRKFLGLRSGGINESETVSEAQIAAMNRTHNRFVLSLVGGLCVLVLIGVVQDILSGSPIGQTSSPIVAPAKAKK